MPSPLIEAMLETSAPAYQVLADRIRIAHLDFETPKEDQ